MAAPSSLNNTPKLIVFDLDYTLWPFWVDTHVTPPFRKKKNGNVVDKNGSKVEYYSEVPEVLKTLHNEGYKLAVASRTSCTQEANSLLKLFDWDKYFSYKEIYPEMKTTHFHRFLKASGIEYKDMVFFDDECKNIQAVSKLGVTCILVNQGVSRAVVKEGLAKFASNSL